MIVTVELPDLDERQLGMLREIVDGAADRPHSSIWLHVEGKEDLLAAAYLSYFGLVERVQEVAEMCEVRITRFGRAVLEEICRS